MLSKGYYIINRETEFLFKKRKAFGFFVIVYPLLMFILLCAIFSSRTITKVPTAVIDNSKTAHSKELIRNLNASPYIDVKYYPLNQNAALDLMQRSKVFAVVDIDKDYEKGVVGLKGGKVGAFINNQYLLLGGNVNKAIYNTTGAMSTDYLQKTAGKIGVPSYALDSMTSALDVTENTMYNPQMNYVYFLVLGIISALLQLFIVLSIVFSLLSELKSGRAKEIRNIIKQHPFRIVNAKIAVYLVLYMCVLIAMFLILFLFFGLPLKGNILLVILAGMAFIFFTAASGVLIAGATGNLRVGLSMASVYAAPAFAYFGVSFPVEAMPGVARLWAEILPGTHFNRVLVDQIMRGEHALGSMGEIIVMFAMGAAFLYIGSKLYSRFTANEKSWGPKI